MSAVSHLLTISVLVSVSALSLLQSIFVLVWVFSEVFSLQICHKLAIQKVR